MVEHNTAAMTQTRLCKFLMSARISANMTLISQVSRIRLRPVSDSVGFEDEGFFTSASMIASMSLEVRITMVAGYVKRSDSGNSRSARFVAKAAKHELW